MIVARQLATPALNAHFVTIIASIQGWVAPLEGTEQGLRRDRIGAIVDGGVTVTVGM